MLDKIRYEYNYKDGYIIDKSINLLILIDYIEYNPTTKGVALFNNNNYIGSLDGNTLILK